MPIAEQKAFLRREVFSLTLNATAQRSQLYRPNTPEVLRLPLQKSLRTALDEMADSYLDAVAEVTHVANIERLANELSAKHPEILVGKRFRIGTAQKALNLYLKYLWCLREVAEPPHCPIDAVVLRYVPTCREVRWTKLDSIEEYRHIIASAKIAAEGASLARWELALYSAARRM